MVEQESRFLNGVALAVDMETMGAAGKKWIEDMGPHSVEV